jgi:hypothetical protein
MRDAQVDAIKTYLYLKIACGCNSLSELFCQGTFNTLNLDEIELSSKTKSYLTQFPGAAALFEYACLENDNGEQVSKKLETQIRKAPESIDYVQFFRDTFYGVSYSDYLFSLPMGAGKTYLMAAFIYIDLYFALNEPQNPSFAHNFIILAPSGLKSSVVPSLKTIQNFNPSWVIPEPAASEIQRLVIFEVLDQDKTASKSNKTKNPNVQKIANHQPLSELFGLVAVTNAEKVILERVQVTDGQLSIYDESDDEKDRKANELRNLIGKIPSLSIFIDEVHHAVNDEIKLRAVVNHWAENHTMNSVIGFSGTPYLEKAEKISVTDKLSISTVEITNTVYYYPLVDGIGNFLKCPIVKIADIADSARIIENGAREFLRLYKDTVYDNGLTAKLGIYCSSIEKLEEVVYPIISRVVAENGMPSESILKFHKGNKKYPQPADSQMQYDSLDKAISKVRIVLLVQIGKEGWDCRSLTGIILSQEGDCSKNMVLQTSCRCLRQVDKNSIETALIYLNNTNAEKLNTQLQQRHHISLKEFTNQNVKETLLKCYDRTDYLKLPKVDFYQLMVGYETLTVEYPNPEKNIPQAIEGTELASDIVKTTDFSMQIISVSVDEVERGTEATTFSMWLYRIVKGSFGSLSMGQLNEHLKILHTVFDIITYEKNGAHYFSTKYDHATVEANIRKAFCECRTFDTKQELIPTSASLLNIANFKPEIKTDRPEDFYPEQETVERIILDDSGKLKISKADKKMMELAKLSGQTEILNLLRKQNSSHPQKDRSFHYLPYHTDSDFEKTFLAEVLSNTELERLGLEVYYNGDRAMTEFKIKCYKKTSKGWQYVGMYTPDFLIIQRQNGKIHKAIIVETKGKIYANDPAFQDKRSFTETEFVRRNNDAFGYERFDYLYLEDSLSEHERLKQTYDKICNFFEGA